MHRKRNGHVIGEVIRFEYIDTPRSILLECCKNGNFVPHVHYTIQLANECHFILWSNIASYKRYLFIEHKLNKHRRWNFSYRKNTLEVVKIVQYPGVLDLFR